MASATAKTAVRSASPASDCGVPTAMKMSRAAADRRGEVGGEGQPPVALVALHEFQQARLVDRQAVVVERRDLRGVVVDADDVVAALGETGAVTSPTYPVPMTATFTMQFPPW